MRAVLEALAIAVQARIPVLLWGAPGTGKTSVVRQLGEVLGLPVEVVIASIREPTDFAGLPIVAEGGVRFAPRSWALRLVKAGKGILFLDELTTAPPAVQAALLRVVLERTVGDIELPEGVAVAAAANPAEEAAGGWELSLPLANRFVHLEWKPSVKDWCRGVRRGWRTLEVPRLPEDWESGVSAVREEIAGFIEARPALLVGVPRQAGGAGALAAWPSPRSWELLARVLAAAGAASAGVEAVELLAAGAVGRGAAVEFLAARQKNVQWSAEEALRRPGRYRLGWRPDELAALLDAVCTRVIGELRRGDEASFDLWERAWKLLVRVAKKHGADAAAPFATRLMAAGEPDFLPPLFAVDLVCHLRGVPAAGR